MISLNSHDIRLIKIISLANKTNESFYFPVRIIGLVDIFGVYAIYRELTFWSMYFLSFPFVISSIMLFLLYWHETMTSSSIIVHPFIVKMRIPFFVTAGVLLLLQIAVILTGVFNVRGFVEVASKFAYSFINMDTNLSILLQLEF